MKLGKCCAITSLTSNFTHTIGTPSSKESLGLISIRCMHQMAIQRRERIRVEGVVYAGKRVYQSIMTRYAYTKFIGLETMSLLSLRPFLGVAIVFGFGEAAAAGGERGGIFSYLGPATTAVSSFGGP